MNDDIFPKYAGNQPTNKPENPPAPPTFATPVPPTTPAAPQTPPAQIPPVKNQPANPPAKTIFFSQMDINRVVNSTPTPSFKGGRLTDLQTDIESQFKKPEPFQSPEKYHPQEFRPGAVAQPQPSVTSDSHLKNVRTFESDVAEVLSHKKTSTTSIAIAESKRKQGSDSIKSFDEAEPSSHILAKLLITILCLVLIGGGIYGAYYLYSNSALAPAPKVPEEPTVRVPLVATDSQSLIAIDGMAYSDIKTRIIQELAKTQAPNTIRELILTQTTNRQGASASTNQISSRDMIDLMSIKAPDILLRSLKPDWMLGLYSSPSSETSYFVIVTNDFFQNAFAGMLQWESVMADDIKAFIYAPSVTGIANAPAANSGSVSAVVATSTATSTATTTLPVSAPLTPYFTIRGQFSDRTIRNRDVREFRTIDGKILFLYTFIDNSRLLVANNEDVVVEIMKRVEKEAFVR